MDRAVQSGLMILAGAVLVVTAVLLPVVFLRPATPPAPPQELPAAKLPVRATPPLEAPKDRIPSLVTPGEDARGDGLSRGQRFRIVHRETMRQLGLGGLSAALARAFVFPHSREDAIFGIDISHHNTSNCGCRIDWNRIADHKVAFVYLKATEGRKFTDPRFTGHWESLARHPRIHRGAYHFLRADADIEEQAKYFLARMGKLLPNDLPPVMDLEWDIFKDSTRIAPPRERGDYWSNYEPDEILERALKWLAIVEKETGRIPVVYTSRTWWIERIKDEKKLERIKRYPIWISAMEEKDLQLEKPGARGGWAAKWNWSIWQFTNRGDLSRAGMPNPQNANAERIDVNIFPGPLSKFQVAMGIAPPIVVVQRGPPAVPTEKPAGGGPGGVAGGKSPQKEPPKEMPKAIPKESQSAAPANGGSVTGAAAAKEPPKEAPKETSQTPPAGSQVAAPGSGTAPAETGGKVVAANEPPKESPRPAPAESQMAAPQVAAPGSGAAPADTGKVVAQEPPKESPKAPPVDTTVVMPAPGGRTDKPAEAVVAGGGSSGTAPVAANEAPSETPKEPQAEPQVAAPANARGPSAPSGPATPSESSVVVVTEPPKETPKAAPTETQVAAPAAGTGAAGTPPTESSVVVVTEPPREAAQAAPTETQVAAPAAGTGAAGTPPTESSAVVVTEPQRDAAQVAPTETQVAAPAAGTGATAPSEPPKEPAKELQVASVPKNAVPSSPPTGDGAAAPENAKVASVPAPNNSSTPMKAPESGKPAAQKQWLEIVLLNGRIVRVDTGIDPDVLMKFVTLLERQ